MDDLDMLGRDFGFGARGKSNPMRSSTQSDLRSIDDPLFSDVFGGPQKYSSNPNNSNSNSNKHSAMSDFDYDSIFNSSEPKRNDFTKSSSSNKTTSSFPVYDKPVYDEDIFDGLPGVKNKSVAANVRFEDDVFASNSLPPLSKSRNQKSDFDELLGNLGKNEKVGENYYSSSAKSSSSSKGFDDLLVGFGTGSSASSNRPIPESSQSSVPTVGSKRGTVLDDPFVVLGSSSTPGSSSHGVFTDPLEEISKLGKSRSARAEASSGSGGAFDDIDPLGNFAKPASSFSPGKDNRGMNGSPSRSATFQADTSREQKGNSSFRYSESNTEKKVSVDNIQEPPLFDVPNVSTDFQRSFGQTVSPQYNETGPQVDMSPTSEGLGQQFDDVWLTVSEIPLFTQPTAAPPPSRPPPPLPRQTSRSETGYFSSSSRKKDDDMFSPSSYSQYSQSPKQARPAAKGPPVSQFDELEDFAMGKSRISVDESAYFHSSEETNAFSAAAASAAAMKDAMDKAEAKFRHAKEVREREYAKAARNKESVQLDKDDQDEVELEFRETQERLERERKQNDEEEREQRRLERERERERERSREIEREKARQAVERATREARDRAAADARERMAAETRLKAERSAVEKVNAEARGRAERAAVQRVQAEARERAAAGAKERAEKAAAEARERAAAEARERLAAEREKEARDKASVARAEAEARRRAERAAADRAAAEARGRAATEARERAATAKMDQQKNDNDLEAFFSMGRASSAPRPRANSTFQDPFSDQQFQQKGGSEAAKRTSSSTGASSNMKKASSTTNIVDDLSSIFGGAPSSGDFQDVEGETEERRRARLDRHQRTQERAAKALAEKNQRDLHAQREQEERHRIADTLDIEIKRWAAGKEGNLRALLSTMQYVLWPECGWQPVSLTDLITGASVKKVYRKATLCIHPDKVQQKGANLQQKYIAEKVFDLLKEAWNKFNSEELF